MSVDVQEIRRTVGEVRRIWSTELGRNAWSAPGMCRVFSRKQAVRGASPVFTAEAIYGTLLSRGEQASTSRSKPLAYFKGYLHGLRCIPSRASRQRSLTGQLIFVDG